MIVTARAGMALSVKAPASRGLIMRDCQSGDTGEKTAAPPLAENNQPLPDHTLRLHLWYVAGGSSAPAARGTLCSVEALSRRMVLQGTVPRDTGLTALHCCSPEPPRGKGTPVRCRIPQMDPLCQARSTSGSDSNRTAPHPMFQSPGLCPIQILIKPYIVLTFVWGSVLRRAVGEASSQIK